MISLDISEFPLLLFMATCSVSTKKPALNLTHDIHTQDPNRSSSDQPPMDQNSASKRQPVSGSESSEVATHQRWIQEYHRSKQERQPSEREQQQQQPKIANGYKVISPRLLEQKPAATMNGTNARFDALTIDTRLDNAKTHERTEQAETDLSLQRNQTELLDGYKVYRGITPVPLRSTRNHEINPSSSSTSYPDSPKFVASSVVSYEPRRRASLQSFYYPDKLVISAKYIGKDGQSQSPRQSSTQYHNMARGYSFPLRNHVPVRCRPHSATLATSSSSHATSDKVKGSKAKQTVRKARQSIQTASKASSLKHQGHISRVVDTCNAQQRDGMLFSPRQLGTLPRPSYKLDISVGPKSEPQPQPQSQSQTQTPMQTQNRPTPKSILKNNSCVDANAYLAIRPLKADHALARETQSGKASPYLLKSDFCLNDFILSSREVNKRHPAASDHSFPPSSHVTSATPRTVACPKRPMSAVANPSKYELDGGQSSGRKSVTFNSYVSLMMGNRVSTIRSLSVDV